MRFIEPPFTYEHTKDFILYYGLCESPSVWPLEWKGCGRVIGYIIFHEYKAGAYEMGWIISRDYWGLGIASKATEEIIHFARKKEVTSLIIECSPDQQVTQHIAKKYGFGLIEESTRNVYKRQL